MEIRKITKTTHFLKYNIKKTVMIILYKSFPFFPSYVFLRIRKIIIYSIQKTTFVQNVLLFAILDKHKLANYIFLLKNVSCYLHYNLQAYLYFLTPFSVLCSTPVALTSYFRPLWSPAGIMR